MLTIVLFFFSSSLKMFLFGRFSFPLPYNDTIFFVIYSFYSLHVWELLAWGIIIIKEGRCRRGRPALSPADRDPPMPCIKIRDIGFLQSDHSRVIAWRCSYFSTSKPPSERTQWCSDGSLFGGAAVDTENCRPGAVGGGEGISIVTGISGRLGWIVHLRRNWFTTKKRQK